MQPISAELVAAKLHSIKHQEYGDRLAKQLEATPRLAEMLWAIQYYSWEPGGLDAFSESFLRSVGDRIGLAPFWKFGCPNKGQWTQDQCVEVWRELVTSRFLCKVGREGFLNFQEWAGLNVGGRMDIEAIKAGAALYNFNYFITQTREMAQSHLPGLLYSLCVHKDQGFESPWYCSDLPKKLLDFIEQRAAGARRGLGQTKAAGLVFDRLGFGLRSKYPVLILGESRAGKTKSVEAWCRMRPGLARMVTVPDTDREWKFFAAHADALRIDYTDETKSHTLERQVEYTLSHGGIFLVYDESHYLLPARYSRKTAPRRLNWVRGRVIDRGVGAAFFATRQSYHDGMDKFVSITRYQMAQWLGRIAPELVLPSSPDKADMIEAARAIFPTVALPLIRVAVGRCLQTETDFQHLELIIRYAIDLAEQAGRAAIEAQDIDRALADIFQQPAANPGANAARVRGAPRAKRPRRHRGRSAGGLQKQNFQCQSSEHG